MKKISTRLLFSLFVCLWGGFTTAMATTPVFSLQQSDICSGDTVQMDLFVEDFTEMTSFQFTVAWDEANIQIKEILEVNPTVADNILFGNFDDESNILTVSWFDPLVTGVTMPDSTVLFTIKYATVAGDNQILSMVDFTDTPTSRELSAIENNDITIVDGVWNNSSVRIDEPTFVSVDISDDVDMTGAGAIDITIMEGEAPYEYLWSDGQTIEDLSNLSSGDYSATITDAKGCQLTIGPFTVGNIVGLDEIPELQSVTLTPNPASDQVTIQVRLSSLTSLEVSILDIRGKQLKTKEIANTHFNLDFELSDLASGIYFVQLKSTEGVYTEKLMLQR